MQVVQRADKHDPRVVEKATDVLDSMAAQNSFFREEIRSACGGDSPRVATLL